MLEQQLFTTSLTTNEINNYNNLMLVHESNKTIISPNIPKEVRNCVSNKLI